MRIQSITILLPEHNEWVDALIGFIRPLQNPSLQGIAKPEVRLMRSSVKHPEICLEGGDEDARLILEGMTVSPSPMGQGEMPQLPECTWGVISIEECADLLQDLIEGVDHVGLNIPTRQVGEREWQTFRTSLSKGTSLYRYPGEEWPFTIPSTDEEFHDDIRTFSYDRAPKFEWVYDEYADLPYLQFALYTKAMRSELEKLLPSPVAFSIQGLEDHFRSLFIKSPWPGLGIRMDLYYSEKEDRQWRTGEWLVREGRRIGSAG
ncbi:hypothetical protein ABER02_10185 [Rossellomorea marisflavi]|uniref:hypothetical protein n=1 Tax=Rossellomorea marisflavi TaxID=189381 RepID=UPI003D2AA019